VPDGAAGIGRQFHQPLAGGCGGPLRGVRMTRRPGLPLTHAEHVLEAGVGWEGHTRSEDCPCRPFAAVDLFGKEHAPTTWVHRREIRVPRRWPHDDGVDDG